MLTFHLEGHILEVKETLMGSQGTRVTHWYYDTEKWLKSSHGKKGDTPDRIMTQNDIKWIKERYLPKALEPKLPAQPLNSAFDHKAKDRYARVTASMEKDNFYLERAKSLGL